MKKQNLYSGRFKIGKVVWEEESNQITVTLNNKNRLQHVLAFIDKVTRRLDEKITIERNKNQITIAGFSSVGASLVWNQLENDISTTAKSREELIENFKNTTDSQRITSSRKNN